MSLTPLSLEDTAEQIAALSSKKPQLSLKTSEVISSFESDPLFIPPLEVKIVEHYGLPAEDTSVYSAVNLTFSTPEAEENPPPGYGRLDWINKEPDPDPYFWYLQGINFPFNITLDQQLIVTKIVIQTLQDTPKLYNIALDGNLFSTGAAGDVTYVHTLPEPKVFTEIPLILSGNNIDAFNGISWVTVFTSSKPRII